MVGNYIACFSFKEMKRKGKAKCRATDDQFWSEEVGVNGKFFAIDLIEAVLSAMLAYD